MFSQGCPQCSIKGNLKEQENLSGLLAGEPADRGAIVCVLTAKLKLSPFSTGNCRQANVWPSQSGSYY